jgi:cell division protein FtsL
MQNLEAQLHTLLEEIAPEAHNYDETAKIIATASAIINKKHSSRKLIKTSSRQVEAFLTDALLQSMSVLETWEDDYSNGYVDGRGLSASQLIQRVATSAKSNWGHMDILNPDGLKEALKFDEDEEEFSKQTFENAEQTPEALETPGRGKHKTDSLSGPVR